MKGLALAVVAAAVIGGAVVVLFTPEGKSYVSSLLAKLPTQAKAINVEFLEGSVDQNSIESLAGLACRNYDHIVHLKIDVDWNAEKLDVEQSGYQRLVFWNKEAEYLFPIGSYFLLHGEYIINGYFIPR